MKNVPIIIILLMFNLGCATIMRGTSEVLQIQSDPTGAHAELSTGQSVTTPGQVKLKRDTNVIITFTKEGYEKESVTVYPTVSGTGAVLGSVFDYGTGAIYDLTPNPVFVTLKPIRGSQPKTEE